MISSLRVASLFDRRIQHGRRDRLSAEVRELATRVEAGTAPGRVFRPTAEIEWIPAVIAWSCLAMMAVLVTPMLGLSSFGDVLRSFSRAELAIGVPVLVLGAAWAVYYTAWLHLLAPWYLRRHADAYYVYVGDEGLLRRHGRTLAFVPWGLVTGSSLSVGQVVAGDGTEPVRTLELRTDRGWWLMPALVKGYGPGVFFQDWYEYSVDHLRDMAVLIDRRVAR